MLGRHGPPRDFSSRTVVPPLLTTAATILCAHGGRVAIIPRQTKVLAGGVAARCVPARLGAPPPRSPRGGRVATTPRQTKVLAGGSPVVCVPDLMGAPIAGCALPPTPA